jgi:hypothetical protein
MLRTMKRLAQILICLGIATLATLATATPIPQKEAEVLKTIKVKYDQYLKAFSTKDQKFLDSMLTADYTANQAGQPPMNRETTIKTFNALLLQTKDVRWGRTFSKVTLHGKEATLLFDGHFTATMPGRDGKPHVLDYYANNEDTWIQVKGDWKLRRSHLISSSTKVDGKSLSN